GERDIEAEFHRLLGDLPRFGEAVHHPAGFGSAFLAHDCERVGSGSARVDDERPAGFTRRADMHAKALTLPLEIAVDPIVVEAGFADGDDSRIARGRSKRGDSRLHRVGIVWVHADRRIKVLVFVRERMHGRPRAHLDRHAERVRDGVLAHRGENLREIVAQIGKIEVAVRIDVHRTAVRTRRPAFGRSPARSHMVWVERVDARCSPRMRSIVVFAAAPVSSSVNCTPIPCVRLPCPPSGVIHTTLPCTAMRFGSSISESSMNTSSPSAYGREVGMKMPPPFRNGMYAAYSAAFSRMLSESTPGRASAGVSPGILSAMVTQTGRGIRSGAPRRRGAVARGARAAIAGAADCD